jgi:hypothetical protein
MNLKLKAVDESKFKQYSSPKKPIRRAFELVSSTTFSEPKARNVGSSKI